MNLHCLIVIQLKKVLDSDKAFQHKNIFGLGCTVSDEVSLDEFRSFVKNVIA